VSWKEPQVNLRRIRDDSITSAVRGVGVALESFIEMQDGRIHHPTDGMTWQPPGIVAMPQFEKKLTRLPLEVATAPRLLWIVVLVAIEPCPLEATIDRILYSSRRKGSLVLFSAERAGLFGCKSREELLGAWVLV